MAGVAAFDRTAGEVGQQQGGVRRGRVGLGHLLRRGRRKGLDPIGIERGVDLRGRGGGCWLDRCRYEEDAAATEGMDPKGNLEWVAAEGDKRPSF